MKKTMMMAVAVLALGGMAACEKAGENVDNAIDDVRGQPRDLSDGAMEKTGEAIDKAAAATRDGAVAAGNAIGDAAGDAAAATRDGAAAVGDAIHDATDGDPNTKPN